MRRLLVLVILIVGLLATLGCSSPPSLETNRSQLQALGFFGQHDLRRIEQASGMNGRMDGGFFLGIGGVSGSLTAEQKLQFYWGRTADEFIVTALPYSMFRFVIDESKAVPTVEFVFDEDWLVWKDDVFNESEKSNLNFWFRDYMVKDYRFRVAIVRISLEDFEREIYLPSR